MNRRSANTTKIFVGSLPAGTTVEELRNLFGAYGPIAECDVVNRCGFIHMEDRQLAFKAIDDLNNFNFKGNRISVEKGRVKPSSSIRSSGSGGPMRHGHRDNREPYRRDRDRGRESMMTPRQSRPYTPYDDRPRRPLLDDRRTLGERNVMMDHRRPLMEPPVPVPVFDRRPQPFDMGGYNDYPYPPHHHHQQQQEQPHQRGFVGVNGPPPRRDMPPPRRY